jgi:hypothetical protein
MSLWEARSRAAGLIRGSRRRAIAAVLLFVALGSLPAPAAADTLEQNRIERCQALVRRQANLAEILPKTWRVWEEPVPRRALPVAALAKIKTRDLLYDGGIGGFFELKATTSASRPREIFAFCSYDNLFVWLQGIYDGGLWTQFDATDYVMPY